MGSLRVSTAQQCAIGVHSTQPQLDLSIVHRVYCESLYNIMVSKVSDFRFETAFMTWKRLEHNIPAPDLFKCCESCASDTYRIAGCGAKQPYGNTSI